MTKKLSEIGTHCTPSPHSYTQYEPYWTFSKEERRELVKAAINGWESFKLHVGFADGRLPTFEELCEEQGI